MCCGEAFHELEVQGVEGLILVGALFPPSMAPASQQGLGVGAQAVCFCTVVAILISSHLLLL
jgi:hypothetical protein